ncbi:MAG: ATP-binding cassette domain-containing protein [bacterium]
MNEVIKVKNFSKKFGDQEVVSDISFDVKKGETFALLGANGSGKTTTIRCLLDILKPSGGELLINNNKYTPLMSNIIGYLPEERGLYTARKVLETMIYIGELKGLQYNKAMKWSEEYLEKVGLGGKANEKIKKLSSGQQQKIQLGITIINNPELLILDEPTKGLDPVNRELLINILDDLKKQGSTIVFITHQMDEVEKIADRLLMIKDGKKVLYGDVNDVKAGFGDNRIHLIYSGTLPKNKELYEVTVGAKAAKIIPKDGISPDEILKYLVTKEIRIKKFEISAPSLQEIFVTVSNAK